MVQTRAQQQAVRALEKASNAAVKASEQAEQAAKAVAAIAPAKAPAKKAAKNSRAKAAEKKPKIGCAYTGRPWPFGKMEGKNKYKSRFALGKSKGDLKRLSRYQGRCVGSTKAGNGGGRCIDKPVNGRCKRSDEQRRFADAMYRRVRRANDRKANAKAEEKKAVQELKAAQKEQKASVAKTKKAAAKTRKAKANLRKATTEVKAARRNPSRAARK